MARTEITVDLIKRTGVTQSPTTGTADGHMFANDGRVFAEIKNSDASARSVTFTTPAKMDDLNVEDLVVSIAAGATLRIGPFPPDTFNKPTGDPDAGKIWLDYEATFEAQFATAIYGFDRTDLPN